MIRTSHVGSFPFDYRSGLPCRILRELREIGIDAPPYPQLRDFVEIYLEPLVEEGLIERRAGFYYADPEKLADAEPPEPRLAEAEESAGCREDIEWLRGPVTGVFTLASKIYVREGLGLENTLLTNKEVVTGFLKQYVLRAAKKLVGLGYNIVFFDEPILGVMVGRRRILYGYTAHEITGVYEEILGEISVEKGIHVCGSISPKLFEILTGINGLDIVNLEFYGSRKNLDRIDQALLERSGKKLAPGIASSKQPRIESVDEILGLLEKISEKAGGRIDLVSADCGFGGLKGMMPDDDLHEIVMGKLRNIVEAVRIYRERHGMG